MIAFPELYYLLTYDNHIKIFFKVFFAFDDMRVLIIKYSDISCGPYMPTHENNNFHCERDLE
jgi:hypothetical protein